MPQAYLIFHLNLAFSSIEEKQRPLVIERCYTPLLDLIEQHNLPIGIEMTGWTLRQIQQIAPDWVARFRSLLGAGRCELIGSGYIQLIGPLVPHSVNQWNQRLGLDDYQNILGLRPSLALVNEMAFSSGLVANYLEAGYRGIVMDRDNVRLALALEDQPYEAVPSHALSPEGAQMPVLWSDSILFQKLQRFAHGEISLDDYLQYFHKRATTAARPLAAYCNDAEIFDFRPGRFATEPPQRESEWRRVAELLIHLRDHEGVVWLSPSAALAASLDAMPLEARTLSSIRQPVPVKKQAKYNLARWAVSGRNNLWLNACCHRLEQQLTSDHHPDAWRELCELWASDFRTHITNERWQQVRTGLERRVANPVVPDLPAGTTSVPDGWNITLSPDGIFMRIETADLRLTLKRRKGLTIHSLAFRSQGFVPVVGTLPHGYFDAIEYGADFYTGGIIIDLPGEHQRITDLLPTEAEFHATADELGVFARIDTPCGPIEKTLKIRKSGERISLRFRFPGWKRPRGIVRLGTTTLLPEAFDGQLRLSCKNGGAATETFPLDRNCDHSHPSSSLVSSTTGLGASSGEIRIGDDTRALRLSWNPAHSAAFPMLIHQRIPPAHLTRLVFSLAELDDTSRPEGDLPDFSYTMEADSSWNAS